MKVLVVTAHTRWTPHWETELEIMQRHIDAGDTVKHLHCNSELLACDDNPFHNLQRCRECIGRRRAGLELLSSTIKTRSFLRLTHADRKEIAGLQKRFSSLNELKDVTVENFDIGFAVVSSIVSTMRNAELDLGEFGNLVPRFMVATLSMYRSVQHYLDQHHVDRVYVFNGRFASCRAVLRACQSRRVPCFVHERGHNIHHYALFENTTPHDLTYIDQEIRRAWQEADGQLDREEVAEKFFLDRAKGVEQSWYSFVREQQEGLLPHDWDATKRNIVIFNSSEDEFVAIGKEWQNPLYQDQQQGLEKILASLASDPGNLHLYLRVHPNLRGLDNAQTRKLASLKADFLTIIAPDDPVSTYTLIDHANKVVTFGSTVGMEAVFRDIPSILAGMCFYRKLGGTYNPESHEELVALLKADLAPKDKAPALIYGYYLNSFGIPFKYFKATAVGSGTFKGRQINPKLSFVEAFREKWLYLQNVIFAVRTRLRVMHTWRLR